MGKPTSLSLSLHPWSETADPKKVSPLPSLPQGPAATLYGKHGQGPCLTWRCPWHWWAAWGFYFTLICLIWATISHSASQPCLSYLNGLSVAGDRSAIKESGLCLDLKWLQTVLSVNTWVTPELSRDTTGTGIFLQKSYSHRRTYTVWFSEHDTVIVCTCGQLLSPVPLLPECCMLYVGQIILSSLSPQNSALLTSFHRWGKLRFRESHSWSCV